eukprot:SAG22_NODE_167_length_16764_cov_34.845245_3_plen_54_part_00
MIAGLLLACVGIHDTGGGWEHMQIEQYEQALTTIAASLKKCSTTKLLYTTTIR